MAKSRPSSPDQSLLIFLSSVILAFGLVDRLPLGAPKSLIEFVISLVSTLQIAGISFFFSH